MNAEKIIPEMVKAFRDHILIKHPYHEKHSALFLMGLHEAEYAGFRAGYLTATNKLNKEHMCSGCNDIMIENDWCDVCNWAKKA